MTFDSDEPEGFEGTAVQRISVDRSSAERDLVVAGRDVTIKNIVSGLAMLRPRSVDRSRILRQSLFVPPPMRFGGPVPEPFPVADPNGGSVLALLGKESSGRRTVALDLLDATLGDKDREIFELYPDWDKPDVDRIPCDSHTGYLLNLAGVKEPLDKEFHDRLAEYAMRAHSTDTLLVVVATPRVWNSTAVNSRTSPVRIMELGRPSALEVARRRIEADDERAGRASWLTDDSSVFAGLLHGDEPPAQAVHLAHVVLRAEGPGDTDALDGFMGWKHKLTDWFGSTDQEAPERRALQIAAAFLDGARARTVLDAADALLADPEIHWPVRHGGPLGGAGGSQRCSDAELDYSSDGTVSITKHHPGIDRALLGHVWRERPQLVPVLTRWLSAISQPQGIADTCLPRLAGVLTTLAESEGADVVLGLTQDWLRNGSVRYTQLAVDVLDQLAVNPVLGAEVRKVLAQWAQGTNTPERQLAVAEVCRRKLAREYTSVALTRLKYVLESTWKKKARTPDAEKVRTVALTTLKSLLGDTDLSARVLKTLVDWTTSEKNALEKLEFSRTAFLDVFALDDSESSTSPVHLLLMAEAEHGEAVRELLRQGWQATWHRAQLRERAAEVLGQWCDAAETGELPGDAVEEVVAVIFSAQADVMGGELDRLIAGTAPFRAQLRTRLFHVVRETAARRAASSAHSAA
ncbi:hypothetical protein [Streptomyces sp. S465]|uniref:hypothetical protein n=1 Tax=Streptomyces sp. S465 TaxID=2979468 RepID=UPI0022A87A81|nr:hypothetical protein [Streptomyces sp. S465]WAP55061.1 hypothetical protein N6H00_08750 [Streptomyces sp. S465]